MSGAVLGGAAGGSALGIHRGSCRFQEEESRLC